MINNRKVIGLCLTKIHEDLRCELAAALTKHAHNAGYKLIIFNSFDDFYNNDMYDKGASDIFSRVDFSIIDALIIIPEQFHNPLIINNLLAGADKKNIPVITIDDEIGDYYSVCGNYDEAYLKILRHILVDHNITDTVFISGHRAGDTAPDHRLELYKQALSEQGIAFSPENVGYGEYWDGPAVRAFAELVMKRGSMPKGVICANDAMAFGIIDHLKANGHRVPEDVVVTGFDGLASAFHFNPALTTCMEDRDGIAKKCIDVIDSLFNNIPVSKVSKVDYTPIIQQSCGCNYKSAHAVVDAERLYRLIQEMNTHNDFMYSWTNHMLEIGNLENMFTPISSHLTDNSYLCLNHEFVSFATGDAKNKYTIQPDEYLVIPAARNDSGNNEIFKIKVKDFLPETSIWCTTKDAYIMTPIYARDFVCGYYAVKSHNLLNEHFKIKTVARLTNVVFNSVLNAFVQRNIQKNLENTAYTDSMTSLYNLKGITKWFDEFASEPENHQKYVTFSVYTLPNYTFLFENYGTHEIERIMHFVADSLKSSTHDESIIGRISNDEFIVINQVNNADEIGDVIDTANKLFYERIESQNSNGNTDYFIEVNCGCSVAYAGWTGSLETFIKHALSELYLNRLKTRKGEILKKNKTPKEVYNDFCLLVDNNLLTYHYQPIINAKTGEIYAYEALMRTSGGIDMKPLEILRIAEEYNRLDEIEKACMFNIMQHYATHFKEFKQRNVFINTIPGHFLTEEDSNALIDKYIDFLPYFVFEVTEQDTITDEELNAIRHLSRGNTARIAVDDYGTGHSNIVNLLRYSPQVIKIDHFLISDIHNDINKQMFVKNTIEFAKLNHIKVLAEGVETREELEMVIEFGVDYIQGFYTGKPAKDPLNELPDEIKRQIIDKSLNISKFDNLEQVYVAKDSESINLVDLATSQYTFIEINGGNVMLIGEKDNTVDMVVKIADNADVSLTLVNANLKGSVEATIQLGKGSNTHLILIGDNTLLKEGIKVPETATLNIVGDGSLAIFNNRNYSVGIGTSINDAYGKLIFNNTGTIKIISTGDKVMSIGGGKSNQSIDINSGSISISNRGIISVGIGSAYGNSTINFTDADIDINCTANDCICVGSLNGQTIINSVNTNMNLTADGERAVALGAHTSEESVINLESGHIISTIHCDMGTSLGCRFGTIGLNVRGARLEVYGEGTSVCGLGSYDGKCITKLSAGEITFRVLAAEARPYGSKNDRMIITGGNIIRLNEDYPLTATNAFGDPLHEEIIDAETFEKRISTDHGTYTYKAAKSRPDAKLCVYMP